MILKSFRLKSLRPHLSGVVIAYVSALSVICSLLIIWATFFFGYQN